MVDFSVQWRPLSPSIVPLPERAILKGDGAPFYKVEQVRELSPRTCLDVVLQEEIESEKYRKVIFYDIDKKPQLPVTLSLLEKSAKSITRIKKIFRWLLRAQLFYMLFWTKPLIFVFLDLIRFCREDFWRMEFWRLFLVKLSSNSTRTNIIVDSKMLRVSSPIINSIDLYLSSIVFLLIFVFNIYDFTFFSGSKFPTLYFCLPVTYVVWGRRSPVSVFGGRS